MCCSFAFVVLGRRFCPNPVYVIIDVRPGVEGIPTTAYITAEEVEADGKEIQKTFKHLASSVGAYWVNAGRGGLEGVGGWGFSRTWFSGGES